MEKIFDISNYKELDNLQKTFIEYDAYLKLLGYMIEHNIHGEEYESKFLKANFDYYIAKEAFTQYIKTTLCPEALSWSIDFHQQQVKVVVSKEQ